MGLGTQDHSKDHSKEPVGASQPRREEGRRWSCLLDCLLPATGQSPLLVDYSGALGSELGSQTFLPPPRAHIALSVPYGILGRGNNRKREENIKQKEAVRASLSPRPNLSPLSGFLWLESWFFGVSSPLGPPPVPLMGADMGPHPDCLSGCMGGAWERNWG